MLEEAEKLCYLPNKILRNNIYRHMADKLT